MQRTWSFVLPVVGLLVGASLVAISFAAHGAFRDRQELAIEGQHLRVAHRVEAALRELGEVGAEEFLSRELESSEGLVSGFGLRSIESGDTLSVGDCRGSEALEVELFLGRGWVAGPRGPGSGGGLSRGASPRGRRILEICAPTEAFRLSSVESLLLPSSIAAAVLLAGLSILAGVLLERQRSDAEREARRRRLEGLGRAGAGLAHQLRTPLATIKGSCQLLIESTDEACGRRFEAVLEQTERMERLVDTLLDYARPPCPEIETIELPGLLMTVASQDSRISCSVHEGLAALADPDHFRQILDNLLSNAMQASDGEIELRASSLDSSIEILVADRGPGPGENPEGLFEPYMTRRASGVGLGLPIARALAEANGGSLHLIAREGGGTTARLLLRAGRPVS